MIRQPAVQGGGREKPREESWPEETAMPSAGGEKLPEI